MQHGFGSLSPARCPLPDCPKVGGEGWRQAAGMLLWQLGINTVTGQSGDFITAVNVDKQMFETLICFSMCLYKYRV